MYESKPMRKKNRTIKLAGRLTFIITKLISDRDISVSNLAEICGCHQRTILRDIERLMEGDKDSPPALIIDKVSSDIYRLNEESYKQFISMDKVLELASVMGWRSYFPEIDLNYVLNDELKDNVTFFNTPLEDITKEKSEENHALQLNHSTYNRNIDNIPRKGRISKKLKENKNNIETFKRLILFCKEGRELEIEYTKKGAKEPKTYIVQPYQLVNFKGIWYLMAVHDGSIKSFTFVKISLITPLSRMFEPNPEIAKRIRDHGSISIDSKEQLDNVVLHVKGVGIEYFERIDNILPNTTEKTRLSEDTLMVKCKNLSANDVMSVMGQWMPWVTVVEPKEIQEEFTRRIKEWSECQEEENKAVANQAAEAKEDADKDEKSSKKSGAKAKN